MNFEKEIDLRIPDIGENESIELLKWNFKVGDVFQEGDELCDLITDKAAFALEAPQEGVLTEIKQREKTKVIVGQKVAKVKII